MAYFICQVAEYTSGYLQQLPFFSGKVSSLFIWLIKVNFPIAIKSIINSDGYEIEGFAVILLVQKNKLFRGRIQGRGLIGKAFQKLWK